MSTSLRKNWAAGQRRRELDDWSRNPPAEGRLEDISRSRRGASHAVVAVAQAELDRPHHSRAVGEAPVAACEVAEGGDGRGAHRRVVVCCEPEAGVERVRLVLRQQYPLRDG